jgi:deazaflavin-dependent oxidoreductase (nitroreductase family)
MKLSRRIARFNTLINNPIQGMYSWLLPPWVVILHRGRRSGRQYRTPVMAFKLDRTFVIALLYGEESQWLRNLRAAGGGYVIRGGRTFKVAEPRVIDTPDAAMLRRLPPPTRAYCRLADKQAILDIAGLQPGFGPRPSVP